MKEQDKKILEVQILAECFIHMEEDGGSWGKLGSNKVSWPASAYVLIRENTESHQEKYKVSEFSSPGQGPSVCSVFVQNQARWSLC